MRRKSIIPLLVLATAATAVALPTSLNINFANQPTSTDVPDTGFDAAYNPSPSSNPSNFNPTTASGFFIGEIPNASSNTLNIWTDPGDIYGDYEDATNSAHNVFYSNFATGSQTTVTANVTLTNLNNNYHGGGIWLGTDENHYIRLGVIYNGGTANVEMLRENEDLWPPQTNGQGQSGDGNDIADQQEVTPDTVGPAGTYLNTINVELQLILTGSTARAQYSLDGGNSWLPVDSQVPYFAGLATSPADGATVQGGFKVGLFGFGGGSTTTGEALASFQTFNAQTVTLPNVQWNTGSGNASNTANFSNLTTTANLGNEGRIYEFGNVAGQSGVTTVTLDSGLSGTLDVGGLLFSSTAGYTITGSKGLVVNGGLIRSESGVNTISAPMTVSGYARVDSQIEVDAGSKLVLAGATVPRLNSIVINGTGQLDLTTNSLELDYESSATDPFSTILGYLKSGYNKGAWNGSGIISSSAAAHDAGTGLAVIDTGVTPWPRLNQFGGHNVGSNDPVSVSPGATGRDVLIMYTWLGDVNLDGTVTESDLQAMTPMSSGATWVNGDFNYDGAVNADDYALFQLGNALQTGVLAPAPEPGSLVFGAIALAALRRRKK
ncbi:MAG TPA: dockerin type I repeat-containing protein [Tepidisphaeraceae bacterium]|jgi:hypothetical protein